MWGQKNESARTEISVQTANSDFLRPRHVIQTAEKDAQDRDDAARRNETRRPGRGKGLRSSLLGIIVTIFRCAR